MLFGFSLQKGKIEGKKKQPQKGLERAIRKSVMLSGINFEKTQIKSVGPTFHDAVIGSKSLEEKRERSLSPLLWKSVSMFSSDAESLLPRDLFGAKVGFKLFHSTHFRTYSYSYNLQETEKVGLWETKRTSASSRRRDHSSSETKDVSRSLSQQLLESERRWSSHLQATLNEKVRCKNFWIDLLFKKFFFTRTPLGLDSRTSNSLLLPFTEQSDQVSE